jgi:hypothetical protein
MTHEDRFKQWFKTLPKSLQQDLESSGAGLSTIKDPPIGGMREIDEQLLESDSPHAGASEVLRAIQTISKERQGMPGDNAPEAQPDISNAQLIRIIHFFLEMYDCHKPGDLASIQSMIIKIVLGIGDPAPQREIARKYGIPRSTINKRVKQMQEQMGLDHSQFMHHAGHCRAFSLGHVMAQIMRQTEDAPSFTDRKNPHKQS